MSTVLITGGTGLVGTALTKLLMRKGYDVIILSRQKKDTHAAKLKTGSGGQLSTAHWDVAKQTIDEAAIGSADYIIHLAGEGVAEKRWTKKRKEEIVGSRVKSGELLVKALKEMPNSVKAVVSASAIGWYGEDPSIPSPKPFEETDPPDPGFLGEACRLWEDSLKPIKDLGKRVVYLRTGIVLSREGGALPSFEKPIHLGVAAILGNGRQVISWIHIDDLCRLYAEALEQQAYQGAYNAVAPEPVNNKTLTIALARKLRGRFALPIHIPSFALHLALGEMSTEVLKSTTVSAKKIREQSFRFLYPSIESALQQLYTK